jgi:uncharacterized repeat protein (TIGR03803 family)
MAIGRQNPNPRQRLAAIAAVLSLCTVAYAAPKYKVLLDFNGADGYGPSDGVTVDQKGNVYGAAGNGGTGNCRNGCGLIFELTRNAEGKWTETILYSFQGGDDGSYPSGSLVLDAAGSLSGTTSGAGAHNSGTAFALTPGSNQWTEQTLYSFCPKIGKSGCTDGGGTQAGLTQDAEGNLYGTKSGGGGYGGAVFELTPNSGSWDELMLHTFGVKKGDGDGPYADPILDAAGNLYGTTQGGGNQCGSSSCGTVYELTPESGGKWKETVLHRFDDNGKDGITPGAGALLMDSSLNLYGTTEGGGCCGGVVYKLTPKSGGWKETILYAFQGGQSGNQPYAGVVMDKSGNLYGTTDGGGGPNGCGVIYKLAPAGKDNWKYSVLHTFGRVGDGCVPAGNLAIDGKGNLYGGTVLGGTKGYGVVFELTPLAAGTME